MLCYCCFYIGVNSFKIWPISHVFWGVWYLRDFSQKFLLHYFDNLETFPHEHYKLIPVLQHVCLPMSGKFAPLIFPCLAHLNLNIVPPEGLPLYTVSSSTSAFPAFNTQFYFLLCTYHHLKLVCSFTDLSLSVLKCWLSEKRDLAFPISVYLYYLEHFFSYSRP